MGINAQPSNIDAQGNNLAQWLGTVNIPFVQDENGLQITKDAYAAQLATDPWLEQFGENGVLTLVDVLPEAGTGNGDSTSSNSSSSDSDSSQSQTAAGSDAAAGGAGDTGNAGTSDASGAGTAQDASGTSATGDVGNGGTAPAVNTNSDNATGSGAQSDVSDVNEQNGSSSQDSGSSSDAPQSPNSPSATGGDTPAPSPAPVVTPVTPVEPAVITQPVTEASSAVAWLEEFAKTASVDAKAIINAILTYVREMAPGKSQTPESMQRQQVNLNSALSGAINRLDGEFKAVWGGILRLAHEHRDGVFHDRYVYRQLQNAPLNPTQRAFFERTMNMIKLTADPQGRKAGLKQFDKDRTMQHGMTEAGRNRLLSFYNL
jgi:hypothetical protein